MRFHKYMLNQHQLIKSALCFFSKILNTTNDKSLYCVVFIKSKEQFQ